jgi:uncharacterized protein YndB with AHSA1/START domain
MRCESTVTIAKPPAEVFPWLIEEDKVPKWMSRLEAYEALERGPLRPGSKIRQVQLVGGRPLHFQLEVIQLDASRRAVLRFEGSGFRAVNEYDLTDAADGTRVSWVVSGQTTSFKAKLIAPMVQTKLQEKHDGDLARLRALLEGEAAAA